MTRTSYLALAAATLLGCHDDIFIGLDGGMDASGNAGDAAVPPGGRDLAAFTPLPDLRFKWVGAFASYVPACGTVTGNVVDECPSLGSQPSVFGFGPVRLADNDSTRATVDAGVAAWTVRGFGPSNGLGTVEPAASVAGGEDVSAAFADLSTAISSGQIITSFDRNDAGQIGFTTLGSSANQGAYTLHSQWTGARGELDSFALEEASSGRIVTALGSSKDLAADADTLVAFSFTHTGDTTGMYDTQVSDATYAQLGSAFTQLAQGGYVVTALGRIDTSDYVLVGTRIPGQTAPRNVMVSTVPTGTEDPTANLAAGYAIVGWAIDAPGYSTTTTLYEK